MLSFVLFILWVFYLIYPTDLIPDRIPYLGRIDDLLLLAYLYWNFFRKGGKYNRGKSGANRRESNGSNERERNGRHARPEERTTPGDAYAILGVERSASLEEIKRAYREQANRYHPDKVSHLGEEFQEMAKRKFQEIQWAYEKLAAERNSS
ncbi:MAG: DnaJ domain-containing protein [Syntrophobacteraceae bacterium]